MENITRVLKFLKKEGLKLVNIDAKDIHDGTPKLILGLIWTLILRYQIQMGGQDGSPKRKLLQWVNKQIKPYGLQAHDFTKSFNDGKILCALTDSLQKGCIDVGNEGQNLSGDPVTDVTTAVTTAESELDIPALVEPTDVVQNPDDLSMMTYVSYFRDYKENKKKQLGDYGKFGPNAGESYATGKGVEGGFARRPLPFTIHSMNANGEPANNPSHLGEWEVEVTGPKGPIDCKVADNQDGTLSGVYTPDAVGDYQVKIAVKRPGSKSPAEDIKGSVYTLKVREGGDPSKSYAEGPGLTNAFDDQPAHFTVYVKDRYGKPVAGEDSLTVDISPEGAGGSKPKSSGGGGMAPPKFCEECGQKLTGTKFCEQCGWKVVLRPVANIGAGRNVPSGSIPANITDKGDGSYDVVYEAKEPGDYIINVAICDEPIQDMPSHLSVHPGADPSRTYATGRGVKSPGFAGLPHPFTIHCVDPNGNPVNVGGHTFHPVITGPNGKDIPCDLKDNGDGTYSGCYTPDKIGDYVVNLKMDKNGKLKGIKDNPFRIKVKEPADPNKSYAEGDGIDFATDNRPAKFKVYAKDKKGRPVTGLTEGDWLAVKITDPKNDPNGEGESLFPAKIQDNGDGSYDVEYEADTPGDYNLDVTIAEESISNMPKELKCIPGVDASNTEVTGPGVESGLPGQPLPFTVQAKDKYGNNVPVGGDDFRAKVTGPNGEDIPCDLKDNGDGTYTGQYEPTEPGDYTVELEVNDDENKVGDSPYTCTVGEGSDPGKSYCKGQGWQYAYDNKPAVFTVHCNDANGNPVIGETVRVKMIQVDDKKEKNLLESLIAKVDKYMLQKKEEEDKKWAAERAADRRSKGLPPIEDTDGDVMCDVTPNGDGTYKVEYVARIPGTYECHVQVGYKGEHVKKSPKKIPVRWRCPNAPCAHTCTIITDDLREVEDQNEILKQELRKLPGGAAILEKLLREGKIK